MSVTYDDVVNAQKAQGDVIRKTSLVFSDTFSQLTGSKVYLKNEFEQKTGSFKLRGAYYKIKNLAEDEKSKGVVAASAGNHAQGVALASAMEKINCTIVMPRNASPAKVAATKEYGAEVVLEGKNYDESWIKAQEIAKTSGAQIIHAFDDPQIIAAQGVIGLEIMEQLPNVDEIYVPIGGGGLAAGILIAVKTKNPNVKIIGVESKSFPSMKNSLDSGKLETVDGGFTVADGMSVRTPGKQTFEIIRDMIDKIVLVDDEEIIKTIFLLMERSKVVVEPAGAAGLAYLVSKKPSPGKNVVPILCGGNVDMYLLGQIVSKGLAAMGRMMKIFILLKDKPGALKEVVDELASLSANIVEVVHDRLSSDVHAGTTGVTLSLETENQKHTDQLIQHLKDKHIDFKVLT
ncbi:MAG: threonine ammonia-lyase [Thaumarchaeota archaeon]|jgi:threonine dehydratase|nr:threonine ammonia-lyase [Candidatus Nitrosopelagicus sp.]PXF27597.1 MAG: threonine ammonia-lyase [Nitrososphaerota archaeon]RZD35376.1 MAG: threonine ammonia-lyase [Nitrososphaerota archaeon]HIA26006.1 threonine ammonia-lyase [Candidatus Nitrosopelagicus sp.]HIF53431.1 threonine ammonia-lyase [Candidatus Nitrosopelagicus sp.]|tara:strand:+ start:2319 stop:3527 length:1209 start_codon:yes stop_codon:yes gene_type:complete